MSVIVENWPYLLISIAVMYFIARLVESNKPDVHKEIFDELQEIYAGLESKVDDYKFYSTGHLYTWTEYPRSDIESRLIGACQTYTYPAFFFVYSKPDYVFEIDEKNKHIFWVVGKKEFDFKSLKLYEGNGRYRDIHS